jgi:hypothetical protein
MPSIEFKIDPNPTARRVVTLVMASCIALHDKLARSWGYAGLTRGVCASKGELAGARS